MRLMMNLCDYTAPCLAKLRVLIAKSLHHQYKQQYQAEPPRRATRVRDLTFLPHLLELLGKPLKHVTIEDVINKLPIDNGASQATLLQLQIWNLAQPEWYSQCEVRLQCRLEGERQHGPSTSGESPIGGSPPDAAATCDCGRRRRRGRAAELCRRWVRGAGRETGRRAGGMAAAAARRGAATAVGRAATAVRGRTECPVGEASWRSR